MENILQIKSIIVDGILLEFSVFEYKGVLTRENANGKITNK